jgi:hypothetical protein
LTLIFRGAISAPIEGDGSESSQNDVKVCGRLLLHLVH